MDKLWRSKGIQDYQGNRWLLAYHYQFPHSLSKTGHVRESENRPPSEQQTSILYFPHRKTQISTYLPYLIFPLTSVGIAGNILCELRHRRFHKINFHKNTSWNTVRDSRCSARGCSGLFVSSFSLSTFIHSVFVWIFEAKIKISWDKRLWGLLEFL